MFETRYKVRITADGDDRSGGKFTVIVEEGQLSCPPSFEEVIAGGRMQVFTRSMGKSSRLEVQEIVCNWLTKAGAYAVGSYDFVRNATVTFTPKRAKVKKPAPPRVNLRKEG